MLRIKGTLHETVFLEPFTIGGSHFELKVEIYKLTSGKFSAAVFALELFNMEEVEMSDRPAMTGVVPLFVRDDNYDTTDVLSESAAEALQKAISIIQTKLAISENEIDYL